MVCKAVGFSAQLVHLGISYLKLLAEWEDTYLFLYFWLLWVFISMCRLSLVATSGRLPPGCSAEASHCRGFSCFGTRALGCAGSVAVVRRLSYPETCGILLDQGSNLCPCLGRWIPSTGPPGKSLGRQLKALRQAMGQELSLGNSFCLEKREVEENLGVFEAGRTTSEKMGQAEMVRMLDWV